MLNDEVFNKGLEILSKGGLTTTKSTDTRIEGTFTADRDGLFFTSIPYEKGWKAYVDGKQVEVTPIADAMVAFRVTEGEHTLTLKFSPDGFDKGVILFAFGLLILALAWFISSKYMKECKVKTAVTTFLKADVESKKKDAEVSVFEDPADETTPESQNSDTQS